MTGSTQRDGDIGFLHPVVRTKVEKIRKALKEEGIPFEVFEAFRTPERQAMLFAKGRTKPGNKVTWVQPWRSIHQYGMAVDFVLKIDGKWSWDDQGAEAKWWTRMHEIAKENGMTPIYNRAGKLIEKPHIQLEGVSGKALSEGKYPEGGDAKWAERLGDLIDAWDGPGAPPRPEASPQMPGLDDTIVAELEAEEGTSPVVMAAIEQASDERFQKFHAFVKRWEGGFVNNPHDNGGATNMGITQATLAGWRGEEVTVADVQALSRQEADAIFKANYYTKTRCGEMPDRTAMVVYNAAVLHGPRRAIEFLQRAFNSLGMTADGEPLKVDGVIGRKTITAARQTDATVLSTAIMDLQDEHFRKHEDFEHFGAGWLNRLAALREFVAGLPQGAGLRPEKVMEIGRGKLDLDAGELLTAALSGARSGGGKKAIAAALLREVLDKDGEDTDTRVVLKKALGEVLDLPPEPESVGPDGKPPLTPVNAALGEGIGRLLDGKKSATGVTGLLVTAILPQLGLEGPLVDFVRDNSSTLLTVLSVITGWGFLGKIDKAIYAASSLRNR